MESFQVFWMLVIFWAMVKAFKYREKNKNNKLKFKKGWFLADAQSSSARGQLFAFYRNPPGVQRIFFFLYFNFFKTKN